MLCICWCTIMYVYSEESVCWYLFWPVVSRKFCDLFAEIASRTSVSCELLSKRLLECRIRFVERALSSQSVHVLATENSYSFRGESALSAICACTLERAFVLFREHKSFSAIQSLCFSASSQLLFCTCACALTILISSFPECAGVSFVCFENFFCTDT